MVLLKGIIGQSVITLVRLRSHFISQPAWVRFGLCVCLGLILVLGWSRWQNSGIRPLQKPLPQDPYIQVYFNQSEANVYGEPYRQVKRLGDDLEQVIVDAIAEAQSSVDVAVQELNLPRIAQALQERHQAGVRVRVILENNYSRSWGTLTPSEIDQLDSRDRDKYQEYIHLVDRDLDGQLNPVELQERDALQILQTAQIPWVDDTADGSKGSGLMHHKFVVVDGKVVLTGSANFSISGVHGDTLSPASRGNANCLLRIESPALAQLFTQEFDLMWGDGLGGEMNSLFGRQKLYRSPERISLPRSAIEVQFSPTSTAQPWSQSVNGLIQQVLSTAAQTVDLALFVFSDQAISNQLQAQAQQGVQVRALIDPSFIYRNYSEGLDLMGVALSDKRCRYEAGNQPWSQPIQAVGSPQLASGDKLHHKFALIDDRTVIVGSHNWSQAANENNDENLLVIHNATVAAHFKREFERLYEGATLGMTTQLQRKLQQQQQKC